jgi:hypothetical protein
MKKLIAGLTIGMLIGSSTVAMAATSTTVKATLAKYHILVGGQAKAVTANQLVYNGNTYIQLREAGSLFGYNATYSAGSKTISFTSKDNILAKWISVPDYSLASAHAVELQEGSQTIYEVTKGRDVLFTIDTTDLKEGEERAIVAKNGKAVYFTKYKGSVMLNRSDLKKAGLL